MHWRGVDLKIQAWRKTFQINKDLCSSYVFPIMFHIISLDKIVVELPYGGWQILWLDNIHIVS